MTHINTQFTHIHTQLHTYKIVLKSRAAEAGMLWWALTYNGALRELLFIAGPVCSLVVFSVRIYAQVRE